MSSDAFFTVNVRDLVVSAEELPALMGLLKHNKFLHRDYRGKGNGLGGGEYDYRYAKHNEYDQIVIKPIEDAIWLYLNTFGKEVK